jgi:membrane dipeptidase
MDRRQFLLAGLAAPFTRPSCAFAGDPIFIGDMHAHLFFVGPRPADKQPLGKSMAGGGATLATWSLVGDQPWLTIARGGFKQKGSPKSGEASTWLREELARVKTHIAEQKLKIVLGANDIDAALKGDPHVVLAVEGATFLDDGIGELKSAYDAGVRVVQLVHYARNPIGDFQTEKPEHKGLTDFGKKSVAECNRLGVLIDLAHCTNETVADALALSKVPVIWSHSSVTRDRTPDWSMPVWQARQLSLKGAKAITDKGGVVGLWALGADVGKTPESYAARLLEMADWLGDDHVAFGTDMNALSSPAISSYADLARVVRILEERKIPEVRIRKLAIENYARVLKAAFAARAA